MFPLRFIPRQPKLKFMARRWIAFVLSGAMAVVTFVLLFTQGLNLGIDFTGGIVMEVRLPKVTELHQVRTELGRLNLGDVTLQNFGTERDILIRLPQQHGGANAQNAAIAKIKAALGEGVEYRKIEQVGPLVGEELATGAIWAMLLSFAAIMVYIWIRFEWQFGIGGLLALVHDAIITLGFYVVTQIEFNLTSVAAVLTIIGYSVNDSVVIYDRIRENLRKYKKMPISELLDLSINETLSRTIMTVMTTLLALLALILVGGEVIRGFSLAMFFGILWGTYSSVYISAPILIYFKLRRNKD
jgi:preprotein translocase SecF subunit